MGELLCRLNDCINELDDIYDELNGELDTTELLKGIEIINKFYSKESKKMWDDDCYDEEDRIPDFYHDRLQEKLDNYGG